MAIYEMTRDAIRPIGETRFSDAGISERGDLQRLLREQVDIVSPDTLVIAEEFGEWEDSRRRVDLLGLDKDANLVVIELKRTEDGGHMELQAIRYAAMVSAMTFDNVVEIFGRYLGEHGRDEDPRATILEFLEWEEPDEDEFAQDVRIVLASAEFSKELTTAVMWLNERDLSIHCIRLKPYRDGERLLLDVQQIIPLPEAEQYRVQLKEKQKRERTARKSGPDFTKYNITIDDQTFERMAKRNAIFTVVKHLCDLGATPEAISEVVDWKRTTIFRSIDGVVGTEEFIRLVHEKAKEEGKRFDARRYFYCIGLSALMELPSRQTVTCLMVIESCQFVALQPKLAFSLDSSGCVASAGATQNLGKTFADLWNRDCRCPFFFPAVPLARETNWQSAKA